MRTVRRAGWRGSPGRPFPETATLLPGSGSDEVFVAAAFGRPLAAWGSRLVAPRPVAGGSVVTGYRAALDAAMNAALDALPRPDPVRGPTHHPAPEAPGPAQVPVLVGGVSLGAQVAAVWAAERAAGGRPGPAGLLLVLPAWTGDPGPAPAALAAGLAADAVRCEGVAAAVAAARASTPGWLAEELARAWTRHGDGLADSFATTASTPGPTRAQLASLRIPVGLVGLRDDPVHPLAVAAEWCSLLPRAELVTTTLPALGRDRETLGRAATLAWLRATAG